MLVTLSNNNKTVDIRGNTSYNTNDMLKNSEKNVDTDPNDKLINGAIGITLSLVPGTFGILGLGYAAFSTYAECTSGKNSVEYCRETIPRALERYNKYEEDKERAQYVADSKNKRG